jgi:hypothetical protein
MAVFINSLNSTVWGTLRPGGHNPPFVSIDYSVPVVCFPQVEEYNGLNGALPGKSSRLSVRPNGDFMP